MTGTVGAQAIGVAVAPFLTRMYPPEAFGILAIYVSVVNVGVTIASLRYDVAVPLPRSRRQGIDLLLLCLSVNVLFLVPVTIGLLLLNQFRGRPFGPTQAHYLWLAPIGILAGGLYQSATAWATREGKYDALASTRLWQSAIQALGQVGMGLVSSSPYGLLLGDAFSRGLGFLRILKATLLSRKDRSLSGAASVNRAWKRIIATSRAYRRFPLIAAPSALVNALGLALPPLFFAALFGPRAAGFFMVSQRLGALPAAVLGQAAATLYTGETAELIRDRPLQQADHFRTWLKRLALTGGLPVAALGVLAPVFCSYGLGAAWREAGVYLSLSTPMLVVQVIAVPLSPTTMLAQRQGTQFGWDAVRLAAVACVMLVAWQLHFAPRTALLALSLVQGATYLWLLWLCYRIASENSRNKDVPRATGEMLSTL